MFSFWVALKRADFFMFRDWYRFSRDHIRNRADKPGRYRVHMMHRSNCWPFRLFRQNLRMVHKIEYSRYPFEMDHCLLLLSYTHRLYGTDVHFLWLLKVAPISLLYVLLFWIFGVLDDSPKTRLWPFCTVALCELFLVLFLSAVYIVVMDSLFLSNDWIGQFSLVIKGQSTVL